MCCFNEGAIRSVAGDNGPACFTNHRWRICQSLEVQYAGGLRFTTGPIVPPPLGDVETVNVTCGQTVTMNLYNNTCDNESEVSLNSTLAMIDRGVTCSAGGSVDRLGMLRHYDTTAKTHINVLTLTYTAPASLPDCFTTPTDIVRAEGGGGFRDILFKVTCAPPPQQAGAVMFSPIPGTYSASIQVVMTSSTASAIIHYTTDGTEPTQASPSVPNGGAVAVNRSLTLRARAFAPGYTPGEITTGVYTIVVQKAAAPVLTPPAGTYSTPVDVQMASSSPGAVVRYTTDGSDPSETSPAALPLRISTTTTVRARAFVAGMEPSDIVTATYVIAAAACDVAGTYDVRFTVEDDPAGHHSVIALQTATLTVTVVSNMASISGSRPQTLSGTGTLDQASCTFNAAAFGDVAGISGVLTEYRNVTVEGNTITGTYILGTNGALPEGLPIRYSFVGTR